MSTAALDLRTLVLDGQDASRHYADLLTAVTDLKLTETITGASTLDLTLTDGKRALLRSRALTSRSTVVVDKAGFELVQVRKSGIQVNLTFEDIAVAALRRHDSLRKAAAGTTTRANFVRSLIREEPDIPVVVAPGSSSNLVELSRGSGSATKGRSKVGNSGDIVDAGAEDTWTAAARIMGEIGWRVYARHGVVYIAPDSWLVAHNGKRFVLSPESAGVIDVDLEWDTGKPAATATLTLNADIHDVPPGAPLTLQGMGAGNGAWLVETVERSLATKNCTVTAVRQQPTLPEPKKDDTGDFGTGSYNGEYLGDASASAASPRSLSGVTGDNGSAERFVTIALALKGRPYVYGAAGPNAWDCSGFVQWCAKKAGIANLPRPVSAMAKYIRSHGSPIPVASAAYTRGAVLWHEYGGGPNDHIVISLGDGKHTIEAMGKAYGVVVGNINGRPKPWTGAGILPGLANARGD